MEGSGNGGAAYHRLLGKVLNLLDRSGSALLEAYAMNLYASNQSSVQCQHFFNHRGEERNLALDELHKTNSCFLRCLECVCVCRGTYALVEVDGVFAGNNVGDGAALCGLGGSGLGLCLRHCAGHDISGDTIEGADDTYDDGPWIVE